MRYRILGNTSFGGSSCRPKVVEAKIEIEKTQGYWAIEFGEAIEKNDESMRLGRSLTASLHEV